MNIENKMIEKFTAGHSKLRRLFLILLGGVIVLVTLEGLSIFKSDARCTIQQVPVIVNEKVFDQTKETRDLETSNPKTTNPETKATTSTVTTSPATTNHPTIESPTQPTFDQNRKVQLQRQQRLREFCQSNKRMRTQKFNIRDFHLIYSDKAATLYCYVPKVACTNWKKIFQVMDGKYKDPLEIKGKEKVHNLQFNTFKTLNESEIEWRRNLYYSFLFIRHPFERVLSAYRNKFQDPYNSQFQRGHGSRVLRMFRKNLTEEQYNSGKSVTFREFVEYIIKVHSKSGYGGLNEHWNSMHSLCHPCRIKYDFIGSMDSLIEDSETVLKETGWDNRIKFPAKATDKYKDKLPTLMRKYFSQLPRNVTMKLYSIYEDDFRAFGYSADEYL